MQYIVINPNGEAIALFLIESDAIKFKDYLSNITEQKYTLLVSNKIIQLDIIITKKGI